MTKLLRNFPVRRSLLICSSLFMLQSANAATLDFPATQTLDSNTGTEVGPQTSTLTGVTSAACPIAPTATFDTTITNTANSDGADTAEIRLESGNIIQVAISEGRADADSDADWTTTFTLDNFSESLDEIRIFGNTTVMPQNSSDLVDWTVTWTGGAADFRQSTQSVKLYTCGSPSMEILDGASLSSPTCFRFDNNATEGEEATLPTGAADFQIQLPTITSLTMEAKLNTATSGTGHTDSINNEFFAIDFGNVEIDCTPITQNIPVFGPLGLLAMLSGLLWFGNRRKRD